MDKINAEAFLASIKEGGFISDNMRDVDWANIPPAVFEEAVEIINGSDCEWWKPTIRQDILPGVKATIWDQEEDEVVCFVHDNEKMLYVSQYIMDRGDVAAFDLCQHPSIEKIRFWVNTTDNVEGYLKIKIGGKVGRVSWGEDEDW